MKTWLHTHLPRLQSGATPDVISVKEPGSKVFYASWVSLRDVEFKVHEHGRRRCLREGVRNVHAWVVGEERVVVVRDSEVWSTWPCPTGYRQAVYDPWKGETFVDAETLKPVRFAKYAIVAGKNVYYANGCPA